jgi:hypothetical protein
MFLMELNQLSDGFRTGLSIEVGDRSTLLPCPTRSTNSMDIRLDIYRKVVINDVCNILNVQSTGSHICGVEYTNLAGFEVVEVESALALSEVTTHYSTAYILLS